MKTLEDKIPKYISSFDLEEARLFQAIQHYQLQLQNELEQLKDPVFLKPILEKIKNESINAEWALNETLNESLKNPSSFELKKQLLSILLKKQ